MKLITMTTKTVRWPKYVEKISYTRYTTTSEYQLIFIEIQSTVITIDQNNEENIYKRNYEIKPHYK